MRVGDVSVGKLKPGRRVRWLSLALGLFFSSGCGGEGEAEQPGAFSHLELYSWWTSAGEAEALDALLSEFQAAYPRVTVTNAAATDPTSARDRLRHRMNRGEPPDTFQAISGVDLLTWVKDGKMEPLGDVFLEEGLTGVFPEAVLETLRYEGEIYAIPANIERDNNLYYNSEILEQAGLSPPRDLSAFYEACEVLHEKGVVPLAVPAAGWVLSLILFENLMPALLGGEYYLDFFAGRAEVGGGELEELFSEFDRVLACSNVKSASASWAENGDLVREGGAALYVMGDWAKGYFEGARDAEGGAAPAWQAGRDFGVVPAFGSEEYFVFNSAVFGLPRGAQHPDAARAFLGVLGSVEGQEAFNRVKGSVPARTDVDLDVFDEIIGKAVADFEAAAEATDRLLPGYASLTTFTYQKEINPSLLVFAVGGQRARQLDPVGVPEHEQEVPARSMDYILAKIRVTYPVLRQ